MNARNLGLTMLMLLLAAAPAAAQGDWMNMGPEWYAPETLTVDSADVLHIGGTYWGMRYSDDGGETWSPETGEPMGPMCATPSPDGTVYVLGDGAVWYSTDHGASWTPVWDGLPTESGLSALAVDAVAGYVYGGTDWDGQIYRSADGGATWGLHSDVLPDDYVNALAVGGGGRLLAVTDAGVLASDDHGTTFGPIASPLSTHRVAAAAPDGTLYLGGSGVVRSTDNGDTWVPAQGGLDTTGGSGYFMAIQFAFSGTAGEAWLCTAYDGLYHTTDAGDSWTRITDETLPDFNALARDGGGNLYAAAWDGVWKLPDDDTSADGAPALRARLRPARPNPFNPRTVLSFDLPRDARARLVLCDLAGRVVRRLLDADLPAGPHAIPLDAAGLASGVYIARLEAGGHADAQRLTLVR